jgi:hypothetical protein
MIPSNLLPGLTVKEIIPPKISDEVAINPQRNASPIVIDILFTE